ncbi:MAG: putative DNA binding domain-containing protein [Veillonellaceae bacterium]|nr:putative DNA binding domain-containing protein [Veillonellaceae bacterium]
MLSEELTELVDRVRKMKTEMQTLELKAAHEGCPKRLYDTLSSFANQDTGGILLFGMDESKDFALVGVYDVHDLQKKVTEQCNQMVPPIRAVFTVADIEGKTVCSAEIPAADTEERPCYYSGAGRIKGSYVRVGDADLPMTDYEIYSYEAYRKHVHDDERTDAQASMTMLDQEKLRKYVERRKEKRPGFSKLSQEQTYEMLAITHGGVPTLAAILNFGLYPQGYFPQLAITAVVLMGREIGDVAKNGLRFQDNTRIEGTLSDMLSGAMAFCIRNMKVRTMIDPQTGMRKDRSEYPMEALREIVLNALIHRDYSRFTEGTPIQIDFFSDRVEVHSPGGLYGHMTVEDLGKARPDLRNPALATMSEFLLETENRYSGIPTIRRVMKEAGLPAPVFENRRNEFVVTLYNERQTNMESAGILQDDTEYTGRRERKESTVSTKERLLAYCNVPRSRKEIAGFLGIQTIYYVTTHFIRPMLETGELQMTIPERPGSRNQRFVARK